MAGLASSLGGLAGSMYGPLGSAAGSALGGMLGGTLAAIPQLVVSDEEKENKRRLAELKGMQEQGILGLTEAEKQSLYGAGTSQIQGRLREAGQVARQAGAAGMATGAGTELLRQSQAAETQAGLAAQVAQGVEAQNLSRKRELEDEIQSRIQAGSQMKTDRLTALTSILTGGLAAGTESLGQEKMIQGKPLNQAEISSAAKSLGSTDEEASAFLKYASSNPELLQYLDLMGVK